MRKTIVVIVGMLAGSMQINAQGWKQIYPSYEAENYTSIFNGGGDTLYITGLNFTLLRSVDKGEHWEKIFRTLDAYDIWRAGYDGNRVYLLPGGERYRDELMRDTSQAFLFAFDPVTKDTTRLHFPIFGQQLNNDDVFHLDMSVCRDAIFVLESQWDSSYFAILRSLDGGATWTSLPLPDSLRRWPNSTIKFRDAYHGFLWAFDIGASPSTFVLYSTKDGGLTWKKHDEFRQPNSDVPIELPLCWIDDTTAAVIDLPGSLYLSTDAGETWKLKSVPPALAVSLRIDPTGVGYLIGKNFDVYRTQDFGSTWVKVREPFIYDVESQCATIGDSNLVIVSSKGYRIRSTDAGVSWSDQQIADLLLIRRLLFFDRNVGYCSSMYNLDGGLHLAFYRSSNSGATWTQLEALRGRDLYMMPVSANVVYALNNAYKGHGDSLIMKSADAGRSWELSLKDTLQGFLPNGDFTFDGCMNRGADTVFIKIDSTLVRSFDGGRHWGIIPSLPTMFTKLKEYLVGMDMRSRTYGWALSDKKLMRTSDDGEHWDTVLTLPQGVRRFESMRAMDGRYVFVVAETGPFDSEGYHSSDGGVTWTHAPIPAYSAGANFWGVNNLMDGCGLQVRVRDQRISIQRTNDFWATSTTDFSLSKGNGAYDGNETTFLLDKNTAWVYFGDRIYHTTTGGIDATDTPPEPASFALSQNFPNPFSSHTTIPYSISGSGEQQLRIELYDAMGRHVAALYDGTAIAGEHVLPFNASGLVPGMYFVRLMTDGKTEVRKMVVVGRGGER